MMTPRLRSNFAWFLRGIAKALNAHANRIDPVNLDMGKIAKIATLTGELMIESPNAEIIPSRVAFAADGKPFLVFDQVPALLRGGHANRHV